MVLIMRIKKTYNSAFFSSSIGLPSITAGDEDLDKSDLNHTSGSQIPSLYMKTNEKTDKKCLAFKRLLNYKMFLFNSK